MTDNEIIKALEPCRGLRLTTVKMFVIKEVGKVEEVKNELYIGEVLDLINRQKAENQNLKGHLEQLKSRYDNARAEIERLEERHLSDDKLLNDRVQEAINAVSKANQKYVDALEKGFNDRTAELKIAKAEIERLNKEVDRLSQCVLYHEGHISDVIKEFAERLKERIGIGTTWDWVFEDIEDVKQELTGEQNDVV